MELKFSVLNYTKIFSYGPGSNWGFAQICIYVPGEVLLKLEFLEIMVLVPSGVLLKFSVMVLVPI